MSLIEEYFLEEHGISLSECEEILHEGDRLNRLFGLGTAGIKYVKGKDDKYHARRTGIHGWVRRSDISDDEIKSRIANDAKKHARVRDNDDPDAAKNYIDAGKERIAKRLELKKRATEENDVAKENAKKKKETSDMKDSEYTKAKTDAEKTKSTIGDLLKKATQIDNTPTGRKQNKLLKRYKRASEKAKKKNIVTDDDIDLISRMDGREKYTRDRLPGIISSLDTKVSNAESAKATANTEYASASTKASKAKKNLKGYNTGYAN